MKLIIDLKKAREEPDLHKPKGPFIGESGDRWADPQHTIPWPEKGRGEPNPNGPRLYIGGASGQK
jgi:hypothetical protein